VRPSAAALPCWRPRLHIFAQSPITKSQVQAGGLHATMQAA
jgi:hypothetical protein